jgi:MEDS: MEthanogen/methylotroph, DcmR Sensory domain
MTAIEDETDEPVSFAGATLDRYRHVCAFVDSREEEYRIFDPFVTEGLERGEKALHFVDPAERADYVRHFEHLGIDMPTLVEQGRFDLRTWKEVQFRRERFDQYDMLGLLNELLGGPRSPRIRLVGHMGWAATDHPGVGVLVEFEARVNFIMTNFEHVVICVYDTAEFGSDVVIDVLRTHPMALVGGLLQVNPFFVPPEEFLDELRQRGRLAPDA